MTETPDDDPLISADGAAAILEVSRQRWHVLRQTDPDAPPGEPVEGEPGKGEVRRVWRRSTVVAYRQRRDARGAGSEPADRDGDQSPSDGA